MKPDLSPLFTSAGLVGGFGVARATGNRKLGGAVLLAGGAGAFETSRRNAGAGKAIGLAAGYLAVFGLSHPLAKKLGAWPAVLLVTAATAVAVAVINWRD